MDKVKLFTSVDLADMQKQLDDFIATGIQVVSMQCNTTELEYVVALLYR